MTPTSPGSARCTGHDSRRTARCSKAPQHVISPPPNNNLTIDCGTTFFGSVEGLLICVVVCRSNRAVRRYQTRPWRCRRGFRRHCRPPRAVLHTGTDFKPHSSRSTRRIRERARSSPVNSGDLPVVIQQHDDHPLHPTMGDRPMVEFNDDIDDAVRREAQQYDLRTAIPRV